MRMPGFHAEASLRQTEYRYRMEAAHGRREGDGNVIPQAPRILDCFCLPSMRFCCCRNNGKWVCGASSQA